MREVGRVIQCMHSKKHAHSTYHEHACNGGIIVSLDLKKGSYNRLWVVLAALAHKDGEATLKELSDLSGLPRSSTEDILKKVLDGQVPAMKVKRRNATFTVEEWGCLLDKNYLDECYTKHLSNG